MLQETDRRIGEALLQICFNAEGQLILDTEGIGAAVGIFVIAVYQKLWFAYRQRGCPYGTTEAGLIQWLEELAISSVVGH